ncbi:hypothetical protein WICPIJ_004091 [Wickerhamomyces pijperi]|uniref:Pre-mRNA-splicing factor SLT11 n=1 Tax=Wickerhamomyces pijperi TaxID=599730 RepID=A0A9P8TNM1_WICPI|nr:hypothetical protein WICPIJ_004091 [Wickerhamomyces pijperi]
MSTTSSDTTQPPALCEKCLGPSEHLRMLRDQNSLECKLCTRPFTVYKWKPHPNSPYKQTIICLTCSRQRNCCQCCLLDLTYGISVQMRDEVLKMAGVKSLSNEMTPKNEVTKLYVAGNEDKFQSLGGAGVSKDQEKAREVLRKLAIITKQQEDEKNKLIASGKNHQTNDKLPQNLEKVDVTKIFSKLPLNGSITPEQEKKYSTLFIFGIDPSLPDYKITNHFTSLIPQQVQTTTTAQPIKAYVSCQKSRYAYLTLSSPEMADAITKGIKPIKDQGPGRIIVENVPLFVTYVSKQRDFAKSNIERLKIGSLISKFIRKLNDTGNANGNNTKRKSESVDGGKAKKSKTITKNPEKKETTIIVNSTADDGSFEL